MRLYLVVELTLGLALRLGLAGQRKVGELELGALRVGPEQLRFLRVQEGERLRARPVRLHTHLFLALLTAFSQKTPNNPSEMRENNRPKRVGRRLFWFEEKETARDGLVQEMKANDSGEDSTPTRERDAR